MWESVFLLNEHFLLLIHFTNNTFSFKCRTFCNITLTWVNDLDSSSSSSTTVDVSLSNQTLVELPVQATVSVCAKKAATIVHIVVIQTPCSTLRKLVNQHGISGRLFNSFCMICMFFWVLFYCCGNSFNHILKRQLSCKPTPRCLRGVWSHTSRPAGAVFSAAHCVSTGQVQTFQLSQTESWVQTWAMPLFHILTTAQHEPVRPKCDPTRYNVHHEVCVPNIEDVCRSELVSDFRLAPFQQMGCRGRCVSNNTSDCCLKAATVS